jgi:hypothetical protein
MKQRGRRRDRVFKIRCNIHHEERQEHEEVNKVTAKNVAWPSRNQKWEYLAQRRKGRKEIRLPDLPFLASWRDGEVLSRLALQRG